MTDTHTTDSPVMIPQVGAHVAYAFSRREGANSAGRYHLVLDRPLDSGRLHRSAFDALCKPSRQFWGLEPRPRSAPDCPRCLKLASQHGVTVTAAEEVA